MSFACLCFVGHFRPPLAGSNVQLHSDCVQDGKDRAADVAVEESEDGATPHDQVRDRPAQNQD